MNVLRNLRFGTPAGVFAVLFSLTVQAQAPATAPPPTQQSATSTAGVVFSQKDGNATTGFFTDGTGTVTSGATDPSLATTGAAAAGVGTGTTATTPTGATATGKAGVSNLGSANGANTTVDISGAAQQGNYAGTGAAKSTTFADAGNTTTGTYNGTDSATAPLTGSGYSGAGGTTIVSATGGGTDHATSGVDSTGASDGTSSFKTTDPSATPTNSAGVSGSGVAGSQGVAGNIDSGTFAAGDVGGTAKYAGTNPAGATESGALVLNGNTDAKIAANTVSASAAMTSSSTAKPKN